MLDTNFLIALRTGNEDAQAVLRDVANEGLVVPPWVVVEYATARAEEPQEVLADLSRSFHVVETTPEWAKAATILRRELRAQGKKFRSPDFWIASFAYFLNTYVVTRNVKEFKALGVEVKTWTS